MDLQFFLTLSIHLFNSSLRASFSFCSFSFLVIKLETSFWRSERSGHLGSCGKQTPHSCISVLVQNLHASVAQSFLFSSGPSIPLRTEWKREEHTPVWYKWPHSYRSYDPRHPSRNSSAKDSQLRSLRCASGLVFLCLFRERGKNTVLLTSDPFPLWHSALA